MIPVARTWHSIEPSIYDRARHPEYGSDSESKLLAGIMGHSWCLDIFGPPSDDELAAGLGPHGEASIAPYELEAVDTRLAMRARFPLAALTVERRLELNDRALHVEEIVENLSSVDRPIGWT